MADSGETVVDDFIHVQRAQQFQTCVDVECVVECSVAHLRYLNHHV